MINPPINSGGVSGKDATIYTTARYGNYFDYNIPIAGDGM
jgi:hypothetical protein